MLDETELKPREGELWRLEKVVQRTVPNERRERQKPWCKSHEPLQESSKGPATLGGRRITGGQAIRGLLRPALSFLGSAVPQFTCF